MKTRKSFTVIELLITVSIIAILASFLLPALNAAREKAYEISCAANLKMTGTASASYSGDNDDWIVYLTDGTWNTTWEAGQFWTGKLSRYGVTHGKSATECKDPNRVSTFRCPAYTDWRTAEGEQAGYYSSTVSTYAANAFLCGKSTYADQNYTHKNSDLESPSLVIFAGDSLLGIDSLQGTYSFYYRHGGDPRPKASTSVYNDYPSPIPGRANAVYTDGHVGTRRFFLPENRWIPLQKHGYRGGSYTARGRRLY